MQKPKLAKKAAALRALLRENGMTVRELADEHELDRQVVADLLYLRTTGLRGSSHTAAVKLGLKAAPKNKPQLEAA